jgi:hypothetical protein
MPRMHPSRHLAALLAGAVLLVPAAAEARKGHDKHDTAAGPKVTYVFKGTWAAGGVAVSGGNQHVRRAGLVGTTVVFDLSHARLKVADVNGDGARDEADLQDGARVRVKARLAKRVPGTGPYAAKQLQVKKSKASEPVEPAEPEEKPES